ncbi:PTS sugar transporter subunit IIB [Spiractinospora alimapuensis]|uniref:PTS sugar transporter subunit IIB n=1 Tax=Spiractinospora alimapuensis TaxID=2820884 RepID=UPI001F20DC19|nr:PTS sugar transporter subunit IIB [Spiractinospora alimapuensis]QVQ53836.1 PTS sugar transporter subunit IIB [Spiractinospora alimapuensis]
MRIVTVCGMGLGTSMMLAMNVRGVLADEGISANVEPVDLGSFKTMPADVVIAPREMERQVTGTSAAVVLIDNLVDKDEIKSKTLQTVRSLQG